MQPLAMALKKLYTSEKKANSHDAEEPLNDIESTDLIHCSS
jgi:hypothetical protein